VALAGVYVGLLGVIVAAGSSEAARTSGIAVGFATLIWAIGLIFIIGAYFQAKSEE